MTTSVTQGTEPDTRILDAQHKHAARTGRRVATGAFSDFTPDPRSLGSCRRLPKVGPTSPTSGCSNAASSGASQPGGV